MACDMTHPHISRHLPRCNWRSISRHMSRRSVVAPHNACRMRRSAGVLRTNYTCVRARRQDTERTRLLGRLCCWLPLRGPAETKLVRNNCCWILDAEMQRPHLLSSFCGNIGLFGGKANQVGCAKKLRASKLQQSCKSCARQLRRFGASARRVPRSICVCEHLLAAVGANGLVADATHVGCTSIPAICTEAA